MLIPSIDLKGGQVVQLVQGEELALASDDIFGWVRTFEGFPKVQLIDLDGAFGSGGNDRLVRVISARLPCRVGGGIRSVARAQQVLKYGATAVIVGSSLFKDGHPDITFAGKLAETVGSERIIVAVDSKGGRVVIKGWREALGITPVEAIAAFEPYCSEFLYTHVDTEGLMRGIDMDAVRTVRHATSRRLTAAGGITTQEEIDQLDAIGVDGVVGMAVYTGKFKLNPPSG